MPIEFKVTDTRKVAVPIPISPEDTEQLGKFLVNAGQDGYRLAAASTIMGGDQRDPIVRGLRLTASREPIPQPVKP